MEIEKGGDASKWDGDENKYKYIWLSISSINSLDRKRKCSWEGVGLLINPYKTVDKLVCSGSGFDGSSVYNASDSWVEAASAFVLFVL